MTLQQSRKSFTVDEYHRLAEVGIIKESDRVELIDGDIITMSPTKSNHAGMVDSLIELLVVKLYKKASIKGQNPISLSKNSEPEPDIVVAHYQENSYREAHPTPKHVYILIEVSDSTLKYDQTEKMRIYAKGGIPEYWIINLVDKQVEIYRQPKNEEYHFKQIISQDGEITCETLKLRINFSDLFK